MAQVAMQGTVGNDDGVRWTVQSARARLMRETAAAKKPAPSARARGLITVLLFLLYASIAAAGSVAASGAYLAFWKSDFAVTARALGQSDTAAGRHGF